MHTFMNVTPASMTSTALRCLRRNQWTVSLVLGAGIVGLGALSLIQVGPEEKQKTPQSQPSTASTDSSSISDRRLVGHLGTGPSGEVAVDSQIAYIKSGTNLVVVGVSDPTNPVRVGRASMLGPIADIVVEEERAYVVTNHVGIGGAPYETEVYGLEVVDVSDPTAPKTTDAFKTSGVASEVALTQDFAFVADGGDGLRVIDISDPNRLREVSFFSSSSSALAVAVSEGRAYLAGGPEGLWVIGAGRPFVYLEELGRYTPEAHVIDVTVTGDYAFTVVRNRAAGDRTSDVRVVDVSDPKSPREVGGFELPGLVGHLTVAGNHAYVSVRGALLIFDISDPANPRPTDTLETEVPGMGSDGEPAAISGEVVPSGQYAYLASNQYPRGLYIVELDGEQ